MRSIRPELRRLLELATPLVVTQFGRVIERLAVVRIGPVIEQNLHRFGEWSCGCIEQGSSSLLIRLIHNGTSAHQLEYNRSVTVKRSEHQSRMTFFIR